MATSNRRTYNRTRQTQPERGPNSPDPGQYGPTRIIWTALGSFETTVYKNLLSPHVIKDDVPALVIVFKQGKRDFSIPLTSFRREELDALREAFNAACDEAAPLCEANDKFAREEEDNERGSYIRNYRGIPVVHRLEWKQPEHLARLQGGPDGVPPVAGDASQ